MNHSVIIRQVDLDTATTALVLGVTEDDQIVAAPNGADARALADPRITCIEAGGSGQTHLRNFDHHDTALPLPPACAQALACVGGASPDLERLVRYAASVDLGTPLPRRAEFPSLSAVFSGLRLTIREPHEQLIAGLGLLRTVLAQAIDPFDTMPELPQWRPFVAARRDETAGLAEDLSNAVLFTTRSGAKAGFVESRHFGALGGLYRMGCTIAIACHPDFGPERIRKITIGGPADGLAALLPRLNELSPGWGGPCHGGVIASSMSSDAPVAHSVCSLIQRHA